MLGLDWGLDISAAIEQPRVHDQLFPPFVSIESGLDSGEIAALVGKGHPAIGEFFGLGIGAEQRRAYAASHSYGYQFGSVRGPGGARRAEWYSFRYVLDRTEMVLLRSTL